jgi:membrane protease YdiL (CAAX protease family)
MVSVLPFLLTFVVFKLLTDVQMTINKILLFPLVIGGVGVIWSLSFYKVFFNCNVKNLNIKRRTIGSDILFGIMLGVVLLIVTALINPVISKYFVRVQVVEFGILAEGLKSNVIYLLLWFGPVLWIGVAAFEEITRVILLERLWKLSENKVFKSALIIFTSVFFGYMHAYQGMAGVVSVAILSIVSGYFYMINGRVVPLIIAHGLFDAFGVGMALYMH